MGGRTEQGEMKEGIRGRGGEREEEGRGTVTSTPHPPFGDVSNGRLLLSSHEDFRRDAVSVLWMYLLPPRSTSRVFSLSPPLYLLLPRVRNSVLSGVSVRQRQGG